MDPDSEQIKEVFARFGVAMYRAQCLERQLALILATKYRSGPAKITKTEFDNILAGLFSRTLGHLVSKIGEIAEISEDEKEQLRKALKRRNWLAHQYFWERAAAFMSDSGRDSMIEEIQEAMSSFEALDELFTSRTTEWRESIGITQESVDNELERLVRDREDS